MFSLRIYHVICLKIFSQGSKLPIFNAFRNNLCTSLIQKNVSWTTNNIMPNTFLISSRNYAKGKDKKKDKGKKKIEINETQLNEVINVATLKTQMQKSVDMLKNEYVKNLSLRSTTGSIESIQVSLDGKDYVLQELAQIVRKNPTTLIVNMATFPQAIPAVLKSIEKSGMNLNPQQDGTTLYIPVPKVTKEHRENLAKNAKILFIKCKDNIRDVQNKQTKSIKRNNNLAEDLVHSVQDQITSIGNQYIAEAENILTTKQNELLGKD